MRVIKRRNKSVLQLTTKRRMKKTQGWMAPTILVVLDSLSQLGQLSSASKTEP
jgi:hypothetical protein